MAFFGPFMNYVCEKDNAERGVFTASTENTASSLKHLASVLSVLKSARRKRRMSG